MIIPSLYNRWHLSSCILTIANLFSLAPCWILNPFLKAPRCNFSDLNFFFGRNPHSALGSPSLPPQSRSQRYAGRVIFLDLRRCCLRLLKEPSRHHAPLAHEGLSKYKLCWSKPKRLFSQFSAWRGSRPFLSFKGTRCTGSGSKIRQIVQLFESERSELVGLLFFGWVEQKLLPCWLFLDFGAKH